MVRRALKYLAPKAFNDGLARANELGRSMIMAHTVDRLIDAGCGDGELTMTFASAARARQSFGIEYVDEFRESAKERGITCVKADLNCRWPFEDEFFDLALSSQSVEHLHNTRQFVEECYRILKPGGQVIILTENLASWVNIGALIFGWQPFSTTNINGWSLGNPLIWTRTR